MAKKTIIKKKESRTVADATVPKKKGRKPSVKTQESKKEQIKKTVAKVKKEAQAKTTPVKKTSVKKTAEKQVKAVVNFEQMQEQELKKVENEVFNTDASRQLQELLKNLTAQQKDANLQHKVQVAKVKYRTKYMQLEHERQAWNVAKCEMLNIISKLRTLAMKYAPLEEVFEVAGDITEACNKTNAGKKPLKMPD